MLYAFKDMSETNPRESTHIENNSSHEDSIRIKEDQLIEQTLQLVEKMKNIIKKSSKAYSTVRYSSSINEHNTLNVQSPQEIKNEFIRSPTRKMDKQQRKLLKEKIICLYEDCIPILKKIEEESKDSL